MDAKLAELQAVRPQVAQDLARRLCECQELMRVRLALDGAVATYPSCWRRGKPAGVWDAERAYPYRDRQRSSGALSSAPAVSPALASTPLLSPAAALGGSSSSRHVRASSNQAMAAKKIGTCHGKLASESYDVLSR